MLKHVMSIATIQGPSSIASNDARKALNNRVESRLDAHRTSNLNVFSVVLRLCLCLRSLPLLTVETSRV